IEEAPPRARHLFLTMMQEGELRTGRRTIRLDNNLLYFTTNHGVGALGARTAGFGGGPRAAAGLEDLFLHDGEFERKFLSRIQLFVEFQPLGPDPARRVIAQRLSDLLAGAEVEFDAAAVAGALQRRFARDLDALGVRVVESRVRDLILGPLALLREQGHGRARVRVAGEELRVEPVAGGRRGAVADDNRGAGPGSPAREREEEP
ncbi:MAG: hypothetical protein ACYDA8_20465, partial [Deferrisomatales bacterium]